MDVQSMFTHIQGVAKSLNDISALYFLLLHVSICTLTLRHPVWYPGVYKQMAHNVQGVPMHTFIGFDVHKL